NLTLRATPVELMARAAAAAGDPAAAAPHLAELRAIAESVGTRPLHASARLAEGIVALAAGDAAIARERLHEAVDLFAAGGGAFDLGRARVELARALAAQGRREAGAREAALALAGLEAIGADVEAARARELADALGRPAPRPPAPAGRDDLLTARQIEILRLIAQGLTDGEIAARLVLSRHTVHRHVQNAYDRLGCSSRAAAVSAASRLNLL
ncbi:MAG: hypothetical protein QOD86_2540, partial [Miltoncostaeaceae bacterium]|nr:hypothetical protein [Miltoncostaeaceae bacterium]